jgi:IS4 transposase
LRRIRYHDPDTAKNLVFLTNHHLLPPLTICALYKRRWEIELFFKWVKQNLRIKRFYGTSERCRQKPNMDRHRGLRVGGDH